MMAAYYNEIDPFAAEWLRNLIKAGHIADGIVDERSIVDVEPAELADYTQCHFFAGVGVWSLALRNAGWSDDRPIWTGSCPCQPFSSAGKGSGFDDERHLWPAFEWLIRQCGPATIIGEQVASKDADPWINLVQADLEAVGYGFGAIAFPSAGVGAPHIRDRLYWVAHADHERRDGQHPLLRPEETGRVSSALSEIARGGTAHGVGHAHDPRPQGYAGHDGDARGGGAPGPIATASIFGGLGDPDGESAGGYSRGAHAAQAGHGAQSGDDHRLGDADHSVALGLVNPQGCGRAGESIRAAAGRPALGDAQGSCAGGLADNLMQQRQDGQPGVGASDDAGRRVQGSAAVAGLCSDLRPGPTNSLWRDADWLLCRDGKWRPVEPGTFPLAHGDPARVGRLRAYGNAINAEAARVWIETVMECIP